MHVVFLASAIVAVIATLLVITRLNAFHALLYLIVSLLAVALAFFVLGAPFAAALEVIVYAGAIMVLFVFVVMMLNLGEAAVRQERGWLSPGMWVGPSAIAIVLAGLLAYTLAGVEPGAGLGAGVGPEAVGTTLFGPYLIAVELASMLLLAGLVGAYHIGREATAREEIER
jgi:NADH-quinone oxidoreductase subunit J